MNNCLAKVFIIVIQYKVPIGSFFVITEGTKPRVPVCLQLSMRTDAIFMHKEAIL